MVLVLVAFLLEDRQHSCSGEGDDVRSILGQSSLLELLSLLVDLLVVGAEKVNVVVLLSSGGGGDGRGGRGRGAVRGVGLGRVPGERNVLRLVGRDVRVPSGRVEEGRRGGGSGERLEDGHVGLGGRVAGAVSAFSNVQNVTARLKSEFLEVLSSPRSSCGVLRRRCSETRTRSRIILQRRGAESDLPLHVGHVREVRLECS